MITNDHKLRQLLRMSEMIRFIETQPEDIVNKGKQQIVIQKLYQSFKELKRIFCKAENDE